MNPEFHDTTGEQTPVSPQETIRSYVEALACQIVGSSDMITHSGSYTLDDGKNLVALIQDLEHPFREMGLEIFPEALYCLSIYDKTGHEYESLVVSNGTDGILAYSSGEYHRDLSDSLSQSSRDNAISSFIRRYQIDKLVEQNSPPQYS